MKQDRTSGTEPAHDILRGRVHPLDVFFAPKTVAVVGATETAASVGRTIVANLIGSPFGGAVFPINPKRDAVLGIKAYPNVAAAPAPVELAVIATPARTVPAVVGECVDAGVRGAIIISAGFKETGAAGAELEAQILAHARRGRMRVVGPNCLGLMSPLTGLNATFAGAMARPGNVGFISQSGALCTAILDWSLREFVGFSAFVSVGSMLDVGWGDLIDYLGDDPRTRSIIIYMESIGDPRSFLSAARQVALSKPIIIIKAGRTEAAAKAAASHTGALAGSDEVLDAAFRRVGVLRVANVSDLFYMAEVLAKQPRPRGSRLVILTNAGGPGVLATDALISQAGELAPLADETIRSLNQLLPRHWSHDNPVDILGDASAERYAKTVEIISRDLNSDGLLVILAPQGMTDPTQVAEELKPYAKLEGKPLLASWMGGAQVAAGEAILNRAGIPTFAYPDTAVRAFQYMWRYSYNLRGLYETPQWVPDAAGTASAGKLIEEARNAGRTLLTEFESKQLLKAYGIPTVDTRAASSENEAVILAVQLGYPVVLKLLSETITHKTDVGGVQLNLGDEAAVRRAYRAIQSSVLAKAGPRDFLGVTVQPMIKTDGYEIIIGSTLDPQFGPVLLFGAGGQLVEIFGDRALALPPLTTTLARRMMEQTLIFKALQGTRGRKAVDLNALEQLLVRFSQLVLEQRAVREIDINPLLASAEGLMALDARVVLHSSAVDEDELPRPAIRPYPSQYVSPWTLKSGQPVLIRPIRPEDEPLMVEFHRALSERSVYLRYFHMLSLDHRVAHERLTRICFVDYDREMVLVAEHENAQGSERSIVAVGRLTRLPGRDEAETAIVVTDPFQNRGLGTELLRRLIQFARAEKIHLISADTLAENQEMQQVCRKLGFRLERPCDDTTVRAVLDL
ncbi:MAG TPA: bifunctional acetate--CoA ligase family protein/GNAT family N-acetyltransferase [Terriglobia bacterium]|nr:bifunctional acetate--CoA ligase family protein/GNAT family N-acetyltransferase [Terriglobia bacterium]